MSVEVDHESVETAAQRPRLVNKSLALVFLSSFGATCSIYLLLSVVPMYVASLGMSGIAAGLATGVLMLSTVLTELVTPRLVARFGYRFVWAAGLVLLGAPALALPYARDLTSILMINVVRGMGFAIVVVVGGALVATLLPAQRRGEGLGLSGIVVGVPAVIGLPLGVWFVGRFGYATVFVAAAAAALAGLAVVAGLPRRGPESESQSDPDSPSQSQSQSEKPLGVLAGLRTPELLRPSLVFAATAMAAGIVVTFLAVALTNRSADFVAVALLVQPAASTLTRWWGGRYGDRRGRARGLLACGVLLSAIGILALALIGSSAAVLFGMLAFGAGFGIAQIASLALMFDRVPTSGYGTVSALWNFAYDSGLGIGAVGFGLLIAQVGYPAGFALTACVLLGALLLTRRLADCPTGAGPAA